MNVQAYTLIISLNHILVKLTHCYVHYTTELILL